MSFTAEQEQNFSNIFTNTFGEFSSDETSIFPAFENANNSGSEQLTMPGAGFGISSSAASGAEARSTGYNTWEQGDFNVGVGAGSNSMTVIFLIAAIAGAILLINLRK